MIHPLQLPGGFAIFCDDIREEVGGKFSMIGVYTDVMNLPSVPILIPQLGLLISYWEDPDDIRPVIVRVTFKSDQGEERELLSHERGIPEEVASVTSGDEDLSESYQISELQVLLKLANLRFAGPGRVRVRAYREEDEIRLGTLRIQVAPQA